MPRSAKIDEAATKLARKAKVFRDRRSFISTKGELRLYGKDMSRLRNSIWEQQEGKCGRCGVDTVLNAPLSSPIRAELHHVKPKSLGGSDDRTNLVILCAKDHRGKDGIHK